MIKYSFIKHNCQNAIGRQKDNIRYGLVYYTEATCQVYTVEGEKLLVSKCRVVVQEACEEVSVSEMSRMVG